MRIIIGAIVGAVVVFIVSAILHMATPLGTMGMNVLQNEDVVLEGSGRTFRCPGSTSFRAWTRARSRPMRR
jgi:hypothetical protein